MEIKCYKRKNEKLKSVRQGMSDFDQSFDHAKIKFFQQKILCQRCNKIACKANTHLKYDSIQLE